MGRNSSRAWAFTKTGPQPLLRRTGKKYAEHERAQETYSQWLSGFSEEEIARFFDIDVVDVLRDVQHVQQTSPVRTVLEHLNDRNRLLIQMDKKAKLVCRFLSGSVEPSHREPPGGPDSASRLPLISQTSDGAGHYAIDLGAPLLGYVIVRREGYAGISDRLDFRNSGTMTRNYVLRAAPACAEGHIYDKQRKPIPGANIGAWIDQNRNKTALDTSSLLEMSAISDSSGGYSIRGVPEGNGSIGVRRRGFLGDAVNWYPGPGTLHPPGFFAGTLPCGLEGVLCQLPGKSDSNPGKCSRNHVPARIVTPKGQLGCGIFRQLFYRVA